MDRPLVNILIPTYEPNAAFLKAALESVKNQTMDRFTVFVHDDHSGFAVRDIVEPYLKDPRFRFERGKKRLGIAGNWNACLKHIDAPFVQFLFQDDLWDPTYVESALTAFHDESIGIVSVHHHYTNDEGITPEIYEHVLAERSKLAAGKHSGHEFLKHWMSQGLHPNLIGEPSFVMLRKSVIDDIGSFNAALPQSLDSEYWMRALLMTNLFVVKESLGTFRVHSEGASNQNQLASKGLFDRIIMLDSLTKQMKKEDRAFAKESMLRAFDLMVQKFWHRMATETLTPQKQTGKRALMKFTLLHPLLALKLGWHYVFQKPAK